MIDQLQGILGVRLASMWKGDLGSLELIEFNKPNPDIGLVTRQAIPGPEKDLVESFVPYLPSCFHWRTGEVALFYEPQIQTTFPDLVVVQYDPTIFNAWMPPRSELGVLDIKIIQHLYSVKRALTTELQRDLGLKENDISKAARRLEEAGLVNMVKSKLILEPVRTIFAIKSLVAIEAKIGNWSRAFDQSFANKWFASESYVLSPVENPSESIVKLSDEAGIGILLLNGVRVRRFQKATRQEVPLSFGSWLFNEWIGRYIFLHKGKGRIK